MFPQISHGGEGGGGGVGSVVQTLEAADGSTVAVDLNAVAEATLNHDGQIILTGEDGHGDYLHYTIRYLYIFPLITICLSIF